MRFLGRAAPGASLAYPYALSMPPEFCRIERWRGYLASTFFVRLPDQSVVESRSFRWRHAEPPPPDGPARAAYDELVSRLEGAGWAREADGAPWYATTFRRLAEVHEEVGLRQRHVEVVPVEPPPIRVVSSPVEPPPEPRPDPVPRSHRLSAVLGAAVVLLAAAGVFAVILLGHGGDGKPAVESGGARTNAMRAPTTSPVTMGVEGSVHSASAKRSLVDLRIAAHGTGSWLEVRRGSATGAVLYSAILTDGGTLHFRAPRLWTRFGAASNLTITADGRPVQLHGTYDKVFVPRR
jgi:hypothetical protein